MVVVVVVEVVMVMGVVVVVVVVVVVESASFGVSQFLFVNGLFTLDWCGVVK